MKTDCCQWCAISSRNFPSGLSQLSLKRGLPAPVQLHHAPRRPARRCRRSPYWLAPGFQAGLRELGRAAGLQRPLPASASDVPRLRATLQHILRAGGERAVRDYAKRYFKPVRQALEAGILKRFAKYPAGGGGHSKLIYEHSRRRVLRKALF